MDSRHDGPSGMMAMVIDRLMLVLVMMVVVASIGCLGINLSKISIEERNVSLKIILKM